MDINIVAPLLYPPILAKPLNLELNQEQKNVLEIKKSLRSSMLESFYYTDNPISEKADFNSTIQRYSDRYSKIKKGDKWKTDWDRLPKELKYFYEKDESTKKSIKRKLKAPNLVKKKKETELDIDKISELIKGEPEEAEENEENEEEVSKEKVKKASDDEEENQEEEADEDDVEEENDYIDTYFDNGEDYGDDDYGGGDDEGPTY